MFSRDLLIEKLHADGFDMESSLNLIYDYLSNRKQRVKVGRTYSSWREILYRVLQGSSLGLLLSNIFHSDLYYFLKAKGKSR